MWIRHIHHPAGGEGCLMPLWSPDGPLSRARSQERGIPVPGLDRTHWESFPQPTPVDPLNTNETTKKTKQMRVLTSRGFMVSGEWVTLNLAPAESVKSTDWRQTCRCFQDWEGDSVASSPRWLPTHCMLSLLKVDTGSGHAGSSSLLWHATSQVQTTVALSMENVPLKSWKPSKWVIWKVNNPKPY